MDKQDWSNQFSGLMSSPLGKEIIRALREDLHDNLITDAENATSQEEAYGLLNQGRGVIKAIEHLQFKSVVPKDEGSE